MSEVTKDAKGVSREKQERSRGLKFGPFGSAIIGSRDCYGHEYDHDCHCADCQNARKSPTPPLPKEVGEALGVIGDAIGDAYAFRRGDVKQHGASVDFAIEENDKDNAALAHLRSRLATKKVSREWVEKHLWGGRLMIDDAIDMLRELGIVVEDK